MILNRMNIKTPIIVLTTLTALKNVDPKKHEQGTMRLNDFVSTHAHDHRN